MCRKGETAGEMLTRVRSWCPRCRRSNVGGASASDGPVEQAQQVSTSGDYQTSNSRPIPIQTRKTYISVFMIIIIVTVFFLVVDAVDSPTDILKVGFSYGYGKIISVLMFLASTLVLFVGIIFVVRLIICCKDSINNRRSRLPVSNKCKELVKCIGAHSHRFCTSCHGCS